MGRYQDEQIYQEYSGFPKFEEAANEVLLLFSKQELEEVGERYPDFSLKPL